MAKFCGKSDDGDVGVVFTAKEWVALATLINLSGGSVYLRLPSHGELEAQIQNIYDDLKDHNLFIVAVE